MSLGDVHSSGPTLNIAVVSRRDLLSAKGGDTTQIMELTKNSRQINFFLCLSAPQLKSLLSSEKKIDAIHIYNMTRLSASLWAFDLAKKTGIPVICTPIWHSVKMMSRFYFPGKHNAMNLQWKYMEAKEFLYEFPRLFNPIKIFFKGYKKTAKRIIEGCKVVQINSEGELSALKSELGLIGFSRCDVIRNACKLNTNPIEEKRRRIILVVGRIEPRKNSLNIIQAFMDSSIENLGYRLVFIGAVNKKNKKFERDFVNLVSENSFVEYLGEMQREEVENYYRVAEICVLASHFETTGLVALEALSFGCKAVVTRSTYPDYYFDEYVTYCEPDSVESISNALVTELSREFRYPVERLKELSWENQRSILYNSYVGSLG